MDYQTYASQLNGTSEEYDVEPSEDRETMRRDFERRIYDQCEQEDKPEGDAAAYVKAVFEGYAMRQDALRASRDTPALAKSNVLSLDLLKRLA